MILFTPQGHRWFNFNYLVAAFPKQLLTVVISKADLEKFTEPEKTYLNKKVCVIGKLVLYNHKPQVVVTSPKQFNFN